MFLTRHICLSSIGGAYVQKEEASGDRPLTSPKARTRNKSSSESPASGSCYIRILYIAEHLYFSQRVVKPDYLFPL